MTSYKKFKKNLNSYFATENIWETDKKIGEDKIKSRTKCFLPPRASVKYKNNKLVGSIFGPRFITSNSHPFLRTPTIVCRLVQQQQQQQQQFRFAQQHGRKACGESEERLNYHWKRILHYTILHWHFNAMELFGNAQNKGIAL